MNRATDQNGNKLYRRVRLEHGYWGANVWIGWNRAFNLRRFYYATRDEARNADITKGSNVYMVGDYARK